MSTVFFVKMRNRYLVNLLNGRFFHPVVDSRTVGRMRQATFAADAKEYF